MGLLPPSLLASVASGCTGEQIRGTDRRATDRLNPAPKRFLLLKQRIITALLLVPLVLGRCFSCH